MQDIVADLKAGRGPAGMLLRDEQLSGQIREAVNNAQRATADLNHASSQADALISDLNSHQIPKKAAEVVIMNETTRQARQIVSDLAKPDDQGVTAGENIRDSLMNANVATTNLADETEALKHNFLLRGFFRRRGHCQSGLYLAGVAYRRDTVFTRSVNYRAWLSGSELFQAGSNGQEELSAHGKALLDDRLAEYGDSVVESPIVIEGYSNGQVPGDQLRLSHSRAILVRQYLENHFQVDSNNVGVVPMRNSPPSGMEHATWDGICIVVLRKS